MAFNVNIAADVTASTLENFNNPKDPKEILQHVTNKPLLRILLFSKDEFAAAGAAAGTTNPPNLREPVMGKLMKDQPGSYVGISGSDVLSFKSSDGAIQTTFPVRWMHAGFQITHDELMQQGVEISKDNNTKSTGDDQVKLYDALQLKKADYQESIMFARNATLWGDGTQDAKAIAGIKSIITDDPTAGVTGGINRVNVWWRHIANTGVGNALPKLQYSKADQTLTETINATIRQLEKYGGTINVALAGSDICDAYEREARAKGLLTQTGWNDSVTNVRVRGIKVGNLEIEYDPTLDDMGESKSIYMWDNRKLRLRPQKKQWGRVTNQNQPSDQFVMLISTTDRASLVTRQMDCCYKGILE